MQPKRLNSVAIEGGGADAAAAMNPEVPPSKKSSYVSTVKDEEEKPGWRKFASFVSPGFLVSLAYLDPEKKSTFAERVGEVKLGYIRDRPSSLGPELDNHRTYAGQYIMQMRNWMRNLMTCSIAITPSLIVSIIGGSSGAGRIIIIASMILSFQLPFALIPLLKFSSSSTKMGLRKNSIYIIVMSWILGSGIIGINLYYLATGFVTWLIHNDMPRVANVFCGIIVFPLMTVYILSVAYPTFRKDTAVTYEF